MALPSAKRPKIVEEEFQERLEEARRRKENLSQMIDKADIFHQTMSTWYINLSKNVKRKLTPQKLKRRALWNCMSHKIKYEDLPKNWISRLQSECSLKLYQKKKLPTNYVEEVASDSSFSSTSTSCQNGPEKPKRKKFLDLTDTPPPPTWLLNYAQGIVLPRVMCMYSAEDVNILYYDYAPKFKDCFGRNVKLGPERRINCKVLE